MQRVLKFVKYLPEFGWEPVVLTVNDGDFPARDESLLKEIPDNTRVYRTKIFEPYSMYRKLTGKGKGAAVDVNNINKAGERKLSDRMAEFIRATFFIPDARSGWKKHAVKEGKKIIDREKPDLIFSSSPPYTCALIAMELKKYSIKKLGKDIKWVSDFRDAWTGYLSTPNRWFIPAAIEKGMEKKTLEKADALTIVAKGIKDDFDKKYPEISKNKKYVLIRNGFDSDDYSGSAFKEKKNEKFTVVYTGSMYGKRNPFYLLDTISELINKGEVDKNKIKFIFVGRMGNDIMEYINNSSLKEVIELIDYVPHSQSINYLMKADAMLLLIDEDKYSKMILSGKVFEYLGAGLITGKPVFAIAGEGEAADLIKETSSGEVIPHHNPEKLAEVFLKYCNSFFENNTSFSINKELVKQYERRLLTKRLAEVFNELNKSATKSQRL